MKRIVWISSWDRACGIADYSKALFPALQSEAGDKYELKLLTLDEFPDFRGLTSEISRTQPDLIHVQHEYAFFGGKNPPRYWFPKLIAGIRGACAKAKIVATAHTVLPADYRFPVKGRGLQAPLRWGANRFLVSRLRSYWGPKTWEPLDGVVVHSRHQIPTIRAAGAPRVQEIPLFIPSAPADARWKPREHGGSPAATVLVFGFITPEKGQDIAVAALSKIQRPVQLVLAGGIRRQQERGYHAALLSAIELHGLGSRVKVTGFVPAERIAEYYRQADLVLAPFRETSGSASLAQGLSRGAPILASDLELNRELSERVPGTLAYFRSEDAEDCARAMAELLESEQARARLSRAALEYAEHFSPARTARAHLNLYSGILGE